MSLEVDAHEEVAIDMSSVDETPSSSRRPSNSNCPRNSFPRRSDVSTATEMGISSPRKSDVSTISDMEVSSPRKKWLDLALELSFLAAVLLVVWGLLLLPIIYFHTEIVRVLAV